MVVLTVLKTQTTSREEHGRTRSKEGLRHYWFLLVRIWNGDNFNAICFPFLPILWFISFHIVIYAEFSPFLLSRVLWNFLHFFFLVFWLQFWSIFCVTLFLLSILVISSFLHQLLGIPQYCPNENRGFKSEIDAFQN